MKLLMNSSMIPSPGTYEYQRIDRGQATAWLREHAATAQSYIGYDQTADHIRDLCGVRPRVNRDVCAFQPGDEALIVKLAYRIADPRTKGQPQQPEWEYGILLRLK